MPNNFFIGQILVGQLNNLYYYLDQEHEDNSWIETSLYACPDTHLVYDHLKENNEIDMNVKPEIKDQLWRLAKLKFNNENKTWINKYNKMTDPAERKTNKQMLDKQLAKVYKSFLLRYILGINLYEKKHRIYAEYSDGSPIQQLTIVGK